MCSPALGFLIGNGFPSKVRTLPEIALVSGISGGIRVLVCREKQHKRGKNNPVTDRIQGYQPLLLSATFLCKISQKKETQVVLEKKIRNHKVCPPKRGKWVVCYYSFKLHGWIFFSRSVQCLIMPKPCSVKPLSLQFLDEYKAWARNRNIFKGIGASLNIW